MHFQPLVSRISVPPLLWTSKGKLSAVRGGCPQDHGTVSDAAQVDKEETVPWMMIMQDGKVLIDGGKMQD